MALNWMNGLNTAEIISLLEVISSSFVNVMYLPNPQQKSKARGNTNIHLLDNLSIYLSISIILDSQYWSHLGPTGFERKTCKVRFCMFKLKIHLVTASFIKGVF